MMTFPWKGTASPSSAKDRQGFRSVPTLLHTKVTFTDVSAATRHHDTPARSKGVATLSAAIGSQGCEPPPPVPSRLQLPMPPAQQPETPAATEPRAAGHPRAGRPEPPAAAGYPALAGELPQGQEGPSCPQPPSQGLSGKLPPTSRQWSETASRSRCRRKEKRLITEPSVSRRPATPGGTPPPIAGPPSATPGRRPAALGRPPPPRTVAAPHPQTPTALPRGVRGRCRPHPPTTPLLQAPLAADSIPLDGVKLPLDWPVAGTAAIPAAPAGLACRRHRRAAAIPAAPVIPSTSSSSTLTSMAEAEHCNASVAGTDGLPARAERHGRRRHVNGYAGALDKLRWSEYFDAAFQATASQQGALQAEQCLYSGKDDVAVPFDVHGLSN
ncbi:LOW QUALITY PROTEIN: hypothetical protein SETIT_3G288000v2 [Setaria italica]|uniref:Uncharacterized protein n=1 Tax=Setaria italica TaxID=4555 RepID=A0A368QKE4_SETIT|nr:LOW QUALITY PROTEIN: hypothetical protein SETIT_3G288000v2 [Setaria italica]